MYTKSVGTKAIVFSTCGVVALAALLLLPGPSLALPPRPPVNPTPTQSPAPGPGPGPASALPGGTIVLRLLFPPTWPWDDVGWQDVWTVVQWQHPDGTWRDVEGWQGAPDRVLVDGGDVVGTKTWWVGQDDLGKGPFRWLAYESAGGPLLGASDPFDLPATANGAVLVEMTLAHCAMPGVLCGNVGTRRL
jgi:hypothetical protein